MRLVCSWKCNHVDPTTKWPHDVKLEEDRGECHTDDCIEFCLTREPIDDNFEQCTSGQPGSKCQVKTKGATK